jgi:NAD(P)-dependent dehydrogenase (short-subunit alcohol dehydrogenase family)
MQIDLAGTTAIVTGSTTGIGHAIALGLARSGCEVVLNGRDVARTDAAVARLKEALPRAQARGVAANVSTAQGCATLVEAAPTADILINNAGVFGMKDFFATNDDEWLDFFEVNVMSGVRLSRACLAGMLKRGWGRVVFISSESALNVPPDSLPYGATKTAQLGLSRGLAELTRGTAVTVNAVIPGPTLSDNAEAFLSNIARQQGKSLEEVAQSLVRERWPNSLLQRFATVEEVANLVLYLCSREASATNGAALKADGGVVRTVV